MNDKETSYTETQKYKTITKAESLLMIPILKGICGLFVLAMVIFDLMSDSQMGIVFKIAHIIGLIVSILMIVHSIFELICAQSELKHTQVKETLFLNYGDVGYFNDVLEFPSEPKKLYRRHYFIHEKGTGHGKICFKYPEKPLHEVSYDEPRNAKEEELLNLCQVQIVKYNDIIDTYDTIVESNLALQNHEDNLKRETIRKSYQGHEMPHYSNSETSKSLNRLSQKLIETDEKIHKKIQADIQDSKNITNNKR